MAVIDSPAAGRNTRPLDLATDSEQRVRNRSLVSRDS